MKLWEIRESDDAMRFGARRGYRTGMRGYREDPYDEAYECGFEDGYRKAMKEAKSYYGERSSRKIGEYHED